MNKRRVAAFVVGSYFVLSVMLWALAGIPLFAPTNDEGRAMIIFFLHIGGIVLFTFACIDEAWTP